jgi:putative pyruvate formate lyase activating enzyme
MKGIYYVDGEVIIHDPGPEMIPVFVGMDPSYSLQSVKPKPGFIPKFQKLRKKRLRLAKPLLEHSAEELWAMLIESYDNAPNPGDGHTCSALDVLHALALRSLSECTLCGRNCGINRYRGPGKCALYHRVFQSEPHIHIAEEPVINPAIVTNFGGCALRCCYCVDHRFWNAETLPPLDPAAFWQAANTLKRHPISPVCLEFTNPTESLHGLIGLLAKAPDDFNLPVVLNCHLYGTKLFYDLAGLIADIWLPDLRYGNDECAKRLSSVDSYMDHARIGLDAISAQDGKVVVRILVLPGHVSCCHEPAMKLLSEYKDTISVSILDQYIPEHEAHLDRDLKRRPTREEINQVKSLTEEFSLKDIQSNAQEFWGHW